jgi:hypothetical protein
MTSPNWSHRINPRNAPADLQDIRYAARDLSQEAHHVPGRTGIVFQQVSQYVILASVAATASLAVYHLWKALCHDYEKTHSAHPLPSRQGSHDRPGR